MQERIYKVICMLVDSDKPLSIRQIGCYLGYSKMQVFNVFRSPDFGVTVKKKKAEINNVPVLYYFTDKVKAEINATFGERPKFEPGFLANVVAPTNLKVNNRASEIYGSVCNINHPVSIRDIMRLTRFSYSEIVSVLDNKSLQIKIVNHGKIGINNRENVYTFEMADKSKSEITDKQDKLRLSFLAGKL